ncbi:FdtA/QdtA family cupin domain-containing protein [Olivibacter ginsenosidimutans]|uniref:FdtA/QdtA family cupin domain-containing protein n=1 Tax=Olivibacter ginsenosidimutans TaxID=1176537 RepID=A0ABP9AH80_9SPHI
MTVAEAKIIQLPKIEDERGNLSFLEEGNQLPFVVKRVYWIYDVPGGEYRGAHAYQKNQELIVALSGSFDVVLDDGANQQVFSLNRSYYGLYVPSGLWRYMDNFSTNALAFIASSTVFNQNDYIRDYDAFLAYKRRKV